MSQAIRTILDYKEGVDTIRQFAQKGFTAGAVTAGGGNTGDGELRIASASENSVAETWTVTCTTGGGDEVAKFSVTSPSTSGNPEATSGVPYSINEVSFCIIAGDTDFSTSDSFTFAVTATASKWTQDRWDTDVDGTGEYELIMHGEGNGSDEIYVGFKTYSDSLTYWNILSATFTGYVEGADFVDQPGYMARTTCSNETGAGFPLYISTSPYHINFCMIPVVDSHEAGGVGWFDSYASPSQWTNPNFTGGSAAGSTSVIGGSGNGDFAAGSNLRILRDITIYTPTVSPQDYGYFSGWRSSLIDGKMRLYPATPIIASESLVCGELRGIYWISPYVPAGGLGTALSVVDGTALNTDGDTIGIIGITFKNVQNPNPGNIWVMELLGDQ